MNIRYAVMSLALMAMGSAACSGAVEDGLSSSEIGVSKQDIVGGTRAQKGEFPWMVRLSMGCGGSILTPQIVLTAAHCLDKSGPDTSITAMTGMVDLQDPKAVSIRSTYVYISPDYALTENGVPSADWALIKLERTFPRAVPLPITMSPMYDAGEFEIAGWGRDESGTVQRHLLKARVPFIDDAMCKSAGGTYYPDVNYAAHLCASNWEQGGVDTCGGDSGGPLFRKDRRGAWIQVGITSWGDGCGQPRKPGVYTQLSTYAVDIVRAVSELASK